MLQQIQDYERVVIEWPKFEHLYADGYTRVKIEKVGENEREVSVE
jgi:hypothetical protein